MRYLLLTLLLAGCSSSPLSTKYDWWIDGCVSAKFEDKKTESITYKELSEACKEILSSKKF